MLDFKENSSSARTLGMCN